MKTTLKKTSLLLLMLIALGCSNNDKEKKATNTRTYINYSVTGNSKNGTFNINGDDNSSKQNVTALVVSNEEGEAALVDFLDGTQLISAGFAVPAAIGITEITDTNPYNYAVGFGFEDVSLQEKNISVNISEIEFYGVILLRIKGSFTGTAVHNTHNPNSGEIIEIPHLVDGEFEYTSPAY